ncbi:Rieske [2Fe-2S] iron-sulfur domain-containing protein [Sphaerosporella brunnea]|uniref:Rieske [2Fe-2S] iron-sulfur domain-containing protein n=1 Tax=Sphaerosporella brunnea TaxID=1250544 RepID=A0A5J5FC47_9PEZI|nr:Rieske [2Fe-2S] iron-sulfur domain-containing protein [Sphaerosporella brunnea]
MDLLPHGVPYAALALGALLCFGLSIYFRTGDPGSKRGSPALNLFSGTGSQEPLRSARTPQQINVSSESEFTNGWWESSKIFDLERRAIFSKSWLYVTHRNQFNKAGDYHQFQIAGFQFFLILGKDNVLRGFHNVCRHRAYPVVRKESGNSTVLGCKYHGWAYNAQGALTKAPQFDNVAGFDKTQNGLFSIATKVMQGMVFVNFDPSKKSESPPAESYNMKSTISRALAERKCTHRWEFEGQFNWKVGRK